MLVCIGVKTLLSGALAGIWKDLQGRWHLHHELCQRVAIHRMALA